MTRQKILITGASSGLGAGMARAFAAQGRDLALCARRTDRLDELKAEMIEAPGRQGRGRRAGRQRPRGIPRVFDELSDELGGIDRVIVNAGIGKGGRWGRASRGPTRPPSRPTWLRRWYRSRPRWRCSTRRVAGIWC